MILKDRFITQLAPDICCKLQKWAYGPNQSLDNLLQLAQTVYYGREYEEKKGRKRQKKRWKPSQWAMKNVLKQPEKNAQRDPGEKGWACYYCGKVALRRLAAPSSMSSLQGTTLEERLPPEA